MSNRMNTKITDGKLMIEIDVSPNAITTAPLSKSGKNRLVASTGGFISVGNGLRLGLNLTAER